MKDSAYAFAVAVDQQLDELSDDAYHRRVGRAKKLREELFPLSRLALYLKLPGLRVEVEAFEDDRPIDGHIRITGYREEDIDVEITYAGYGANEALRSELLATQGYAPGAGPISRQKRGAPISAVGAAQDYDEHRIRMPDAILEAFRKKNRKPYRAGTLLLIAFEEIHLAGHDEWSKLLFALNKVDDLRSSQFSRIYLFNGATNELNRAA